MCWYCDDKFTLGHQLKHCGTGHQLMLMEVDEEEPPVEEPAEQQLKPVLIPIDEPDTPQISLQAMTRSSNYQTMRVKGLYYKKTLQI